MTRVVYDARGLPPDNWPLNGVHGWGMGSRVIVRQAEHETAGVVQGALWEDDGGWCVFVKVGPRTQIYAHVHEIRPAPTLAP